MNDEKRTYSFKKHFKSRTSTIRSAVNPTRSLFDPEDLPDELTQGISIESEVLNPDNFNPLNVFRAWISNKTPTIDARQDCKDVISGEMSNKDEQTHKELHHCAKLAMIAYSLPFYIPEISTHMHLKNDMFNTYLRGFVASSTVLAHENMDEILEGHRNLITLPRDNQIGGFYIRTPIQTWSLKNGKPKKEYDIPSWKNRRQLLHRFISGNVNCYVLRSRRDDSANGEFECNILFRGTSNEFNGIPQYGDHMQNSQLYRLPQYDPIKNKLYTNGSTKIPLFYFYYVDMIENVRAHIIQCLEWLGAMNACCKRIVVTGHSMGAALTLTFSYIMYHHHRDLWDKMEFRTFASPMCCNNIAVKKMEQHVIDSMRPNKWLEVVNTDDFVNIQYMLGGEKGLKNSLHSGTSSIVSWALERYWSNESEEESDVLRRFLRIIQIYPELSISVFMSSALDVQAANLPDDKRAAFRMGQRSNELDLWGKKELDRTYNGTMKLYRCKRRINWKNEYLGRSHSMYVDMNFNTLWAPLRLYEDTIYRNFYAKHGLKHNNRLRIVGLFNNEDMESVSRILNNYDPPTYVPKMLKFLPKLLKIEKIAEDKMKKKTKSKK